MAGLQGEITRHFHLSLGSNEMPRYVGCVTEERQLTG
jgi:hypothetical protein